MTKDANHLYDFDKPKRPMTCQYVPFRGTKHIGHVPSRIECLIQDAYERGRLDEEMGVSSDLSLIIAAAEAAVLDKEEARTILKEATHESA